MLISGPVEGKARFGLATWGEVIAIVERARVEAGARFDTSTDPLDLEYFITPPLIADWVSAILRTDATPLVRVHQSHIFESELLDAAQAFGERVVG